MAGFPSIDIGRAGHFHGTHGHENDNAYGQDATSLAVLSEHDNNNEAVFRVEAQGSVDSALYSVNVFPVLGSELTLVFSSNPRRRGAVIVNSSATLTVQLATSRGLLPQGAGFQLPPGASLTIDSTDTVYGCLMPGVTGSAPLSVYVSQNLDQ
jgi:hypothetical protein